MARVTGVQLELVDRVHDKYYRIMTLTNPALVICQYGRRGASGQVTLQRPFDPETYMYRQIDHKRDKGYRDVSPAINFTWTAPAASALTPRIIKSSDLALRFEQTWVEQYRPALAALANPTSPRSVVVFTNDPDDVRVWPWLAQLHATLTTLPHFIDAGHRTFAIIPTSTLSALPYNTALARTFAGPALPTDDHVTLEIFAGVWTPDDPTLDTSSPAGALATARLLTPAPL